MESAKKAQFQEARFDIHEKETVVTVFDTEHNRIVRNPDESDDAYYTRVRDLMTEYSAPRWSIVCTGTVAARDALTTLAKRGNSELRPGVKRVSDA